MKYKEIRIINSVLSAGMGGSWPVLLLKALAGKKAVFRGTRWSKMRGPESEFVKRISVAPAIYGALGDKMGRDEAFKVIEDLLISIGCQEQWDHLDAMDLVGTSPMERLMAFNERMDQKGAPRFNRREYVKQDDDVCHFLITRCVFNDFFTEAGTPELTRVFCEVDRRFFPDAFPDFRFHRGDSWENTIAYGKDHCEFVFEKRSRSWGVGQGD
jgi:hypothetical protein